MSRISQHTAPVSIADALRAACKDIGENNPESALKQLQMIIETPGAKFSPEQLKEIDKTAEKIPPALSMPFREALSERMEQSLRAARPRPKSGMTIPAIDRTPAPR